MPDTYVLQPFKRVRPPVCNRKVKCLGPGHPEGEEFYFWVTNASSGFGICGACWQRMHSLGPLAANPVRMHAEE